MRAAEVNTPAAGSLLRQLAFCDVVVLPISTQASSTAAQKITVASVAAWMPIA